MPRTHSAGSHLAWIFMLLGINAVTLLLGIWSPRPMPIPGKVGIVIASVLLVAPTITMALHHFGRLSYTASMRYYNSGMFSAATVLGVVMLVNFGLSLFWSCVVAVGIIAAIGLSAWLMCRYDDSKTRSRRTRPYPQVRRRI